MIYSCISAHLSGNRGLQDREKSTTNFVSYLLHFQFLTRPASVTSLINAHSGLKSWHPIVSRWFPLIVVINVPMRKSVSAENMFDRAHLSHKESYMFGMMGNFSTHLLLSFYSRVVITSTKYDKVTIHLSILISY